MLALLTGVAATPSRAAACPRLLDRRMLRLQDEAPQVLCQYGGQVIVVVNTASFCGYTPQYKSLETLYDRYRRRGLVVLGFPSNDFGGQEPGSDKEIAEALFISPRTVNHHVGSILGKLGAANRRQVPGIATEFDLLQDLDASERPQRNEK